MLVRRATKTDSLELAHLIYASAPKLLSKVFTIPSKVDVIEYLQASLAYPDGQYGYQNHWVIEVENKLVACICAWTNKLPTTFHQATLASLVNFYAPADLLTVIQHSKVLQECLPPPTQDEWCLGHVAVAASHRRKGLGTKLIHTMSHQAKANDKSHLSLDVEKSDAAAIKFYLSQGFNVQSESKVTVNMQALGIGQHLHLTKNIMNG